MSHRDGARSLDPQQGTRLAARLRVDSPDSPPMGTDRGTDHENARARGCCRGRRDRLLDRLSPGQGRLDRRGAARARRADLRLHLARRRAPAALQHELRGQPHPRLLGEALQGAGGRDRAQCRLLGGRAVARAHGRVHALRLDRRDGGHPLRVAGARGHQAPLAAGAHGRPAGRALPPRRRLHQPGRRHPGDGARRPAARRRDRAPRPGRRLRARRRRVAGQGPHHGRARRQPPPRRASRSAASTWSPPPATTRCARQA